MNRRSTQLAPGSAFLIALLLLMLGLSAVLAYQALDAARSEARSTDRAMRGYASFATWELARRAEAVLAGRLDTSLARAAATSADGAALADAAARELGWCGCDAFRGAFTVRDGRVEPAGARPAVDAWLRRGARGSALARRMRGGADSAGVEPVTVDGDRLLLAWRVSRGDSGAAVTGMVVDAEAVAPTAFAEAFAGPTLLPAAPRRGAASSNADALAVAVSGRDGRVAWRSGAPPEPRDAGWLDAKVGGYRSDALAPGEVQEPLDGVFAGLTARVAVQSGVALGPVAAEVPHSRLPLLLTVFGLTLALVCVAIVQLRRQQELVRLRDDFVSGVSHELRTPLAQIRLFSDLLDSGRLPTAEQRRRSVRIINEESRRLTYLVENILHFSRAQRGVSRVSADPVEVAPLVREIVDAFAPLARTRDVAFALSLDEGVVARVDPDALRQVLLNLLDNAVKYGPAGQTVGVRMELAGFAVRIAVDDAGPGVPRDERGRIWEPYRRLDRDADSAAGGSGIGLAVVKDLVELHGGRVGVTSAPAGGARFWVEFPYAMHAGPPLAAPAAHHPDAAGVA